MEGLYKKWKYQGWKQLQWLLITGISNGNGGFTSKTSHFNYGQLYFMFLIRDMRKRSKTTEAKVKLKVGTDRQTDMKMTKTYPN